MVFVGYEIPKSGINVTATYALVHFFTGSLNADLYQLAASRSFHIHDSRFTPFAKLAVDKIIFPNEGVLNRWRYRALAGTTYTISPSVYLKASDEFFLTHLTYDLHENRGQAGIYFKVIKHAIFGTSYFNRWAQQTNRPDLMEHTILTEIIISI